MTDRVSRVLNRLLVSGGIVAYHGIVKPIASAGMHVTPEQFELQLRFLRDHYRILPLSEILARIDGGRSLSGCVAITFDDAYAGIASYVLPLISSLDVPVTVFVTTGMAAGIDTGEYWWDAVERTRASGSDERWSAMCDAIGLHALPRTSETIDVIRARILETFSGSWPDATCFRWGNVVPGLQPLRREELRAIAADSRVEFGCHTHTHPALPRLLPAEQEEEIVVADRLLREWLPRVQPVIAYPYGLYDRTTASIARRAGMRHGLSIEGFAPGRQQHPMNIPRLAVSEHWSPASLRLRLNRVMRPLLIARYGRGHAA